MIEVIPDLNLQKIFNILENLKKENYMAKREKKYKEKRIYKIGFWTEKDILRLIFLNPFLFQKFGRKKYLKELCKRLKRTDGSIREKRKKINSKYPNLISFKVDSDPLIFSKNFFKSNSKTASILNNVWENYLNEEKLLKLAQELPDIPLRFKKIKLKLNFELIIYLDKKQKLNEKKDKANKIIFY